MAVVFVADTAVDVAVVVVIFRCVRGGGGERSRCVHRLAPMRDRRDFYQIFSPLHNSIFRPKTTKYPKTLQIRKTPKAPDTPKIEKNALCFIYRFINLDYRSGPLFSERFSCLLAACSSLSWWFDTA